MARCQDNNIGRKKQEAFDKILNNIRLSESLTAKALANYTGLKYSTVRTYLRELACLGEVGQKYPRGPYHIVQKTAHGTEDMRIHGLRFRYELNAGVTEDIKKEVCYQNGYLRLVFNSWRKTNIIECQLSFSEKKGKKDISLGEASLLGEIFRNKIYEMSGEKPDYDEVMVTCADLNWDFAGIRIEGANCITLRSFKLLEKLYNKGRKSVRYEVRGGRFSLKELIGIIEGGIGYSNIIGMQLEIKETLDKLANIMKNVGERLFSLEMKVGELCKEKK